MRSVECARGTSQRVYFHDYLPTDTDGDSGGAALHVCPAHAGRGRCAVHVGVRMLAWLAGRGSPLRCSVGPGRESRDLLHSGPGPRWVIPQWCMHGTVGWRPLMATWPLAAWPGCVRKCGNVQIPQYSSTRSALQSSSARRQCMRHPPG